jgi:GNAT superfamily N-acetyltransferase
MSNLRVQALTIADIPDDGLARYSDPFGYISRNDAAWVRLLRENPHAQPTDLAILLAVDESNPEKPAVVGRLGFYAGPGIIRGAGAGTEEKPFRTFWMDGFFLAESHRSSGIGGMIMLQAVAKCKSLFACGGPSEDATKLYKAAGLKELGPLKRWVFFLNGRPPLLKALKNAPLASLAAPFAGIALRGYYYLKAARAHRRIYKIPGAYSSAYVRVAQFSEAIDRLPKPGVSHFPRDSRSLNWAMRHRRIAGFEIFEGDRLVGYALLKRSTLDATQHGLGVLKVGALLDYWLADATPHAKFELARFTIDYFRRDTGAGELPSEKGRVDVVEFQVFDPEFDTICKSLGMLHAGGLRVLFRPPPGITIAPDTKWFFTHASSDMLLMTP